MQFLLRIENINQEEELKQLKEQDKYKDRLLATVSHDLRTPLNAINYLIDCSKETESKAQRIEDLDMALVNSDLLMSLINDILDYYQMKDNKLRLNNENFTLNTLLKQIYNLMKIQSQLKGINFEVKNKVGNVTLFSDIRRLKQILINLLSNAIKFTEQGFIKLTVIPSRLGDKLNLIVEDTGPGIQPEVLEQLGQPFATFGAGNNQNANGIGLGLNLCKQLIGLLGPNKSFKVKTELGIGTSFSFIIYINMQEINIQNIKEESYSQFNDEENSEDMELDSIISDRQILQVENYKFFDNSLQNDQNPNDNLNKELIEEVFTILIADDNIFNLFVLEKQLKKISSQWIVLKANNGKQALDKFCSNNNSINENNIQLIIMDCEMPIMNGYKATKLIVQKIQKENYINSLIIGYTALLGTKEQEKCLKSGMIDTLLKPAIYSELRLKVLRNLQSVKLNQFQSFI